MADHACFDPSEVYLYRGKGRIPRNAIRVEVHRSVREISDGLFAGCICLESVLLRDGLLRIGDQAFSGCRLLRIFRCPPTVTEIGWSAFYGCSSLTLVELPEGLEEIDDQTFIQCTSLDNLKIPASVAKIGAAAFWGCRNLSSVDLREGLRWIGNEAFNFCRSLRSLRVPSSVVLIAVGAFKGCRNLSFVQLHEHLPMMRLGAFRGCPPESFRFARLSERMEAINMDEQTTSMFENRLNEITNAITEADHEDEEEAEDFWEKCKMSLRRAHNVLTYLELKEAMPILELALWKAKIKIEGGDKVRGNLASYEAEGQESDAAREMKRPKVMKDIDHNFRLSRRDCRVKCGSGIVVAEVLKFFAYSTNWPRLDD